MLSHSGCNQPSVSNDTEQLAELPWQHILPPEFLLPLAQQASYAPLSLFSVLRGAYGDQLPVALAHAHSQHSTYLDCLVLPQFPER